MREAVFFQKAETKEKKPKPKFPPELAVYEAEAESFIKNNSALFATLAGDNTLRYKLGKGFSIALKTGEITLDIKDWQWKHKYKLDNQHVLWSTGHEIAHYWDLSEDPKGMMDGFNKMEETARRLAPLALEIFKKRVDKLPAWMTKEKKINPDKPDEKMTGLELFIYQKLHSFYNCLDDIHVNKRVGRKIGTYVIEGDSHSSLVKSLYRDFLFPTDHNKIGEKPKETDMYDLVPSAKSQQFAFYFLRHRMVPDQDILLSPEVEAIIQNKKILGMPIEQYVDALTRPTLTTEKIKHNASFRYEEIRKRLEPIFIQLLMDDFENQPIPPEPEKKEGEGEGEGEGDSDGEGDEGEEGDEEKKGEKGKGIDGLDSSKSNNESEGNKENKDDNGGEDGNGSKSSPWDDLNRPPVIDKQTVAQYIKDQKEKAKEDKKKENEKKAAERLTPQEKAKAAQSQADKDFAQRHDIPQEVMKDYRELTQNVEKYKEDLANLFEKICKNITSQIELAWEQYFNSGKLDVSKLVRKYGQYFQEGAEQFLPFDRLEAHEQRAFIEKFKLKPEEFRLRFIIDVSGSMEGTKINATKEILVLFMESLATFEDKMKRLFQQYSFKEPPMGVQTQIIVFGDDGDEREVKKLHFDKISQEQEKTERIKGFAQVHAFAGATKNLPAWVIVEETTAADDAKRIKSGKIKDIAIEITDGGTQNVAQSVRNQLHRLDKNGLICRGIQVGGGGLSEQEKEIFDSIWGEDGERVANASELVISFYKLMKQEIEKIRFEIVEEDDED